MITDFLTGLVPQFVWDVLNTVHLALSIWPWLAITTIAGMVIATWLGKEKTLILLSGGALIWFIARNNKYQPGDVRRSNDEMREAMKAARKELAKSKRSIPPDGKGGALG